MYSLLFDVFLTKNINLTRIFCYVNMYLHIFIKTVCYDCRNLKAIVFNKYNFCLWVKGTSVNTTFYGCQNLKLINCAE